MQAPVFVAKRFFRPALRAAFLYIPAIMLSLLAMDNTALAAGNVNLATTYWGGPNGSGYNCNGMASYDAVNSCAQTYYQFRLTVR